jgi:hypothetical protein
MSNNTKIIRANDKCTIPNNNTKCDCVVEKFESNNEKSFIKLYTPTFMYILKFTLITLFIYLVFSYFQK